jgi:DNA polymerase-3 subunit epsilon
MYAVVDVETTGLRTSWHDRIVEIAVVRLDESGRPRDEWCTLVSPDRDLGPQEIHGITAAEARRAPTFAELAGQIVDRLAGHTVVAHNLPFDAGFLASEFAKLGYQVPVAAERGALRPARCPCRGRPARVLPAERGQPAAVGFPHPRGLAGPVAGSAQ